MEIKNLKEEQFRYYIGKHIETGQVISCISLKMIRDVYGLDIDLIIECILGERETAGPYKWIVLADEFIPRPGKSDDTVKNLVKNWNPTTYEQIEPKPTMGKRHRNQKRKEMEEKFGEGNVF